MTTDDLLGCFPYSDLLIHMRHHLLLNLMQTAANLEPCLHCVLYHPLGVLHEELGGAVGGPDA
jgi:hypothetical protein